MKPEITSAVEQLRLFFPRGSTVYCVLRHRSKSGMSREIGFIGIGEYVFHPNYLIATALDMTANKDGDGIKVRGCGMDMGSTLSETLQPCCMAITKFSQRNGFSALSLRGTK